VLDRGFDDADERMTIRCPMKVPYLYEEQIERDAAALLAEYAQARGVNVAPPVPIEDIVEKYLKLGVEFDDMHRLLLVPRSGPGLDPDILVRCSSISAASSSTKVSTQKENPSKEGRYRFTLAHEGGGHWRLHRHLFAKDPAQVSLFNEPAPPSGRLPFKPGQRTGRVAGGFLCVVSADAA